jgi:hypoxanthine phosphoribosyltransferase
MSDNQTAGVGPILIPEAQIQSRVAELGAQISRDYAGKDLVLIGILKGVVLFMADLLRALEIPAIVDFMSISRFGPSEETRGAARLLKDLDLAIEGRDVLVVEILIDTGFTLSYMLRTLSARLPASLGVCVLLDRPKRRLIDVPLDYVGFEAPEDFLVGYGLHFREMYRQLPYIAQYDLKRKR